MLVIATGKYRKLDSEGKCFKPRVQWVWNLMVKTKWESRVNSKREKRIDVDLDWANHTAKVVGSSNKLPAFSLLQPLQIPVLPFTLSMPGRQSLKWPPVILTSGYLHPWIIPSLWMGLVTCLWRDEYNKINWILLLWFDYQRRWIPSYGTLSCFIVCFTRMEQVARLWDILWSDAHSKSQGRPSGQHLARDQGLDPRAAKSCQLHGWALK